MNAGYSGKALALKLGIKEGCRLAAVNPPPHYGEIIGPLPAGARATPLEEGELDFIHLFAVHRAGLEAELARLKAQLAPAGMLWVSWPKRASKQPTDLNENVIREAALSCGLVDVKVCAVDDIWSGLKLVIPRKDRAP